MICWYFDPKYGNEDRQGNCHCHWAAKTRGRPDDDAQYESKKHQRDGNRNRNWTEGKYRFGGKNGNDTEPDMIYYTY